MKLRRYQSECIEKTLDAFNRHASVLDVLATGCGKTVIFATLAHQWRDGRVLVMAHRDELIQQASEKIEAITGEKPAIEMAGDFADEEGILSRAKCVVTSVQTMCRPNRHSRFKPEDFGLLVIDEAHHAVAETYRRVIRHFQEGNPALKLLGVTATPRRADEAAMGQVFECVAYSYDIADAVPDGWLVPVKQRVVTVNDLDFSQVHTVAGDFNQGELNAILEEESVLHAMAAPVAEMAGDKQALIFCAGVDQARRLAEILNRYRANSADWVCGDKKTHPPEVRREIVAKYKAGQLQFLANCGVFLEGFDAPSTSLVVVGRPTMSLSLYVQMLGRGTRPLPGVVDGLDTPEARRAAIASSAKPHVTVLDFVGNADRHSRQIVTAADVLGGRETPAVRQYAKKTMEEEGQATAIDEALERAAAEMALEREEAERRRRIKAKAEYQTREVGIGGGGPVRESRYQDDDAPMATNKQIWKLKSLGVSHAAASNYTKKQASAVIDKLLKKQEQVA